MVVVGVEPSQYFPAGHIVQLSVDSSLITYTISGRQINAVEYFTTSESQSKYTKSIHALKPSISAVLERGIFGKESQILTNQKPESRLLSR